MTCGIYKITNIVTEKFYIGSSKNIERRWKEHIWDLNKNNHDNQHLQNAYNKHGINSFKLEIIEIVDVSTDLISVEQNWLEKSGCLNKKIGYNISHTASGGSGFRTEETKERISKAQKGIPKSTEMKLKLSLACRGRIMSEETRLKISQSNKGKKRSKETREKIRIARLGKSFPRTLQINI